MAGFEVTLYGRIWVTPEDFTIRLPAMISAARSSALARSRSVMTQ
jgi:hypothetical protein